MSTRVMDETSQATERLMVVSADGHAGPPVRAYREYVERRHVEAFDEYAGLVEAYDEAQASAAETAATAYIKDEDVAESLGVRAFLNGNAMPGLWSPADRVRDLDHDGIAAEVIYPQGSIPFHPYPAIVLDGSNIAFEASPELLKAGVRAYNRWLADFCAANPGRHAGVGVVPLFDIDAAVSEVEWIRSAGLLGGVSLPPMSEGQPAYNDPWYEPFWSACESFGVTLNSHGGGLRTVFGTGPDSRALRLCETDWFVYRLLWFMIFGGVFDRHPNLHLAFTEQRAHWVTQRLPELDSIYESAQARAYEYLPERPSYYWRHNCFLGGSFLSRREVEDREHIGIDNLMWGADYPHLEGTWPWTLASMRATFAGLPADDIRRVLGMNAVECYGFDINELQKIAANIGPTLGMINEPLEQAPREASFSWGFRTSGPWS